MSKSRKKVFPKPPQRFHSKLEKELGRWSNKVGYNATLQAMYLKNAEVIERRKEELTPRQSAQLDKLHKLLQERGIK